MQVDEQFELKTYKHQLKKYLSQPFKELNIASYVYLVYLHAIYRVRFALL